MNSPPGRIAAPSPKRLVLASNNPGKLREFRALLAPHGLFAVPQGELGVGPAAEPFATFLENALAKARHAAAATGLPAIADDSGLCCTALGGAPGARSARWAAEEYAGSGAEAAGDAANNALLVRRLRDAADLRARYVCVLVAILHPADPQPLVAQGTWEGQIVLAPRGDRGFGYDPYFVPDGDRRTVAEWPEDEKNRHSHRAKAMRELADRMPASWKDAPGPSSGKPA